jgi:hypothetical protein
MAVRFATSVVLGRLIYQRQAAYTTSQAVVVPYGSKRPRNYPHGATAFTGSARKRRGEGN